MKTASARAIREQTPILDVRKRRHGEQIRGAIYYNAQALLKADPLVLPLEKEITIALCAGDDETAQALSEKLHAFGYRDVVVIQDGIAGWKAAGLPTEEETQEQPVPGVDEAGT